MGHQAQTQAGSYRSVSDSHRCSDECSCFNFMWFCDKISWQATWRRKGLFCFQSQVIVHYLGNVKAWSQITSQTMPTVKSKENTHSLSYWSHTASFLPSCCSDPCLQGVASPKMLSLSTAIKAAPLEIVPLLGFWGLPTNHTNNDVSQTQMVYWTYTKRLIGSCRLRSWKLCAKPFSGPAYKG